MLKWIYKFFFVFLLCFAIPAHAHEYIELFQTDITVNKDGSLNVTENITVHHEGKQIRRGIVRILSTTNGESYTIKNVLRNNNYEPWFIERTNSAIELNTGDDNLLPSPGTSTYTISYKLHDVLRPISGKEYNELYLNITGKWPFPIEKVLVDVHYPNQTEVVSQYGYQGSRPAKEFPRGSTFEFQDILPDQEITIAQAFSKGTVNIPLPRIWRVLLSGYILMLLFYIVAWFLWGKDPKPKAIVPSWEVPEDLTPLECAYIDNNGNEPKNSFFIHILWLICKRVVKVIESDAPSFLGKKKIYTLTRVKEVPPDYPEIRRYCKAYPNVLTLTGSANESITEYNRKLNKDTRKNLENFYYFKRSTLALIGALIIPVVYTICFPQYFENVFVITYFMLTLLPVLLSSRIFLAFVTICAGIPFLCAVGATSPLLLASFCVYIITIFIFNHLLFQPTIPGQRKKEQIEGIKMFLKTITNNKSIATKDDVNVNGLNMQKRLTPLDMENLFPYAVALGLEKAWTQKFADMFGNAALATSISNHNYYRSDFRKNFSGYCQLVTISSKAVEIKSSGIGSFGGGHAGGGFGGGGGRGR